MTGGNGFLGRALVRRLRESGQPIRLLVRRPPQKLPEDDIHLVYGDLGNPAVVDRAMEGIEVVYHVGAAMRGGPFEFQAGTIWGTRNVVDACERHGVRRLVHVSSMSVLDHAGHQPDVPVNESSPYEPYPDRRGLYTQTKLEAEKTVLEAARDGRIHAVVLRPGQIYGPGSEQFPPSGTIGIAGRWLVVGIGRPLRAVRLRGERRRRHAPRRRGRLAERIDLPASRPRRHPPERLYRARSPLGAPGARDECPGVVPDHRFVGNRAARQSVEALRPADALPHPLDHPAVAVRLQRRAHEARMDAPRESRGRPRADFRRAPRLTLCGAKSLLPYIIISISMARTTKKIRGRENRSRNARASGPVKSPNAKSVVKMIKIGTSTGAIFPKELLAQLKVHLGDTLFTVETPDGVLLTPYDPDVEKQLQAGREFMREYRDTFRALAQ